MKRENIEIFKKNWNDFFGKEITDEEISYIEKLCQQAKDEDIKKMQTEIDRVHPLKSTSNNYYGAYQNGLEFAKAIREET